MRKLIFSLAVAATVFLSGCFDLLEELTVKENGSGVYRVNMDMSGLLDFIDMMRAMDTSATLLAEKSPFKNMDTLIHLKSYTDTAQALTQEEKRLLRDATMQFTVNEKDRVLKAKITYPFAQLADVSKLMAFGKSGKQANLLTKSLGGGADAPTADMSNTGMPDFSDLFDMTYQKGLLERKLNEKKYEEFKSSQAVTGMEGAGDALAQATMSTVLHLPKPAKKVTGEGVQLSDDKKIVTIKQSFKEVMENPKTLAFRIEY